MEEPFPQEDPESTPAELNLCIFPHLREFLVLDLRGEVPRVETLHTDQVFGEEFFAQVEQAFSRLLREQAEYPFSHFIALPIRVEQLVRQQSLLAILSQLGITPSPEGELPSVTVFFISGPILTLDSERLAAAMESFLGSRLDAQELREVVAKLEALIAREKEALHRIERQDVQRLVQGDSPQYFTLWEKRN
ncbi:MAG: hypothetical protein ACE5IG_07735 [Dehalococcoidia bacterium]